MPHAVRSFAPAALTSRKHRVLAVLIAALAVLAFTSASASASTFQENTAKIDIPNNGKASPYGSPIDIQGQTGRVTNVTVSLRGISHGRASDIDVLLVAPDGRTSVVMAGSCGGLQGLTNRNMTFSQSSPSWPSVPATAPECGLGPYRATSRGTPKWPAPAPDLAHPADLDNFIGADPNGTWTLYVYDHRVGYLGKIDRGWALGLDTAPSDMFLGFEEHADPYPTTRTVTDTGTVITDLDVELSRIYHERLSDLDLLLVGPGGQKVILMSDVCPVDRAKGASFTWDDEAPSPQNPSTNCLDGSYKPSDNEPGDVLPAPAPAGPYSTSLSDFDLTDPNGEWRLYAVDDNPFSAQGFVVDRFKLHLSTRPKAAVELSAAAVDLTEGDTKTITVRRSALGRTAAGSVKVTSSPLSASSGTDYTPVSTTVEFGAGEAEKTIPLAAIADTQAEGPETFSVAVSDPTGDASLGTPPPAALVTIHDPAPRVDDQQGGGGGDNNGGGGGGTTPDRTAPSIGKVTLKPARFATVRGKARGARRGTTIRWSLSEPAAVTVRVERRAGRRFVRAGTLKLAGRTGANRKAFTGRIGRKTLRRGTYRLVLAATDAAGNQAKAKPVRFQIVNP